MNKVISIKRTENNVWGNPRYLVDTLYPLRNNKNSIYRKFDIRKSRVSVHKYYIVSNMAERQLITALNTMLKAD